MGFFVIITDDILTKERVNYMGFFQLIFDQFKKDDGAHFTHNLGVSFMRTGVILIILGIIFSMYYSTQPGNNITLDPNVKVTNVQLKHEQTRSRGRKGRSRTRHYYYATFTCESSNGDTFTVYKQPLTRKAYKSYLSIPDTSYGMFRAYDSNYYKNKYITTKTGSAAVKEYHETMPTIAASFSRILGALGLLGGAFILYRGVHEKKRAAGFKRTDYVPTQEEVRKSQEKDDIMREFDEAYKRKYGCEPEDNTRKSYRKY